MTTAATRNHLERAQAHHRAGREKRAQAIYRQILRQEPACTEALFHLAMLLCDMGELDSAIDHFRRLLVQNPDLADVHFNLGTVLSQKGRADEAMDAFSQAIALQPAMADAHINLGILLGICGQLEQALTCFEQALKHAPRSLAARVNQITTLVTLRRHDDAIEAGRRAVDEHPTAGESHNVLGLALDAAGRWDEAVVSLSEAIRLRPNADVWRYFLAARSGTSAPASAPSEYVASLFDRYAKRFDEHLVGALHYRTPEDLLEAVLTVAPGRRFEILDLGCGTGLCGERFRSVASRLVGVDLSQRMIEASQQRGCYQELHVGDIATVLRNRCAEFDLILAADVFIYVGDLTETFILAAAALRPSGLFAFSVESHDGDSYTLGPKARYAHGLPYLRRLAEEVGLEERQAKQVVLRTDGQADVRGWVIVLGKR